MGRCWSSCQPCGETPENFPPLLRGRTYGHGWGWVGLTVPIRRRDEGGQDCIVGDHIGRELLRLVRRVQRAELWLITLGVSSCDRLV